MKNLLMAVLAALSCQLANAVEVAGVKFDDQTRVGNGETVVNGAVLSAATMSIVPLSGCGVRRRLRMCTAGRCSSHTLCQMPPMGPYQLCLPWGISLKGISP